MIKKLFFILFFTSTQLAQAQWVEKYSNPNYLFNQIVFTDELHGYALADGLFSTARLFKTVDGGDTWDSTDLMTNNVSYLHMTSNTKGYVFKSGSPNSIAHSNDGFETFTGASAGLDSCMNYLDVATVNDSTGYQLLDDGRLHKITGYGTAYTPVWDSATFYNFIDMVTPSIGFTGGAFKLSKTTNAGLTWNIINNSLPYFVLSGCFTSATNGYFLMVDYDTWLNVVYRTSDGGITVNPVSAFNAQHLAARGSYCLLADADGNVSLSNNNGLSWTDENTGIGSTTVHAAITPLGQAWICGQNGRLMKRTGLLDIANTGSISVTTQVFPNPTNGNVNIVLTENGDHTCKLYNQLGECLLTQPFNGHTHTFSLHTLPRGIYFLGIENAYGSSITKLVKN